jgi:hypothetical protein
MARRDEKGVRLFTRNGYDFADRFPQINAAIAALPVQSCFVDGEAIVVDMVPIRSGLGLRLGYNVGYLKFTTAPTWNPF